MAFDAGKEFGPQLAWLCVMPISEMNNEMHRHEDSPPAGRVEALQRAETQQTITFKPARKSAPSAMRRRCALRARRHIFSTILKQKRPPQRPMYCEGPVSLQFATGKSVANIGERHGLCIGPHPQGSQLDRHADRMVGTFDTEGSGGDSRVRDEERAT